MNIDERIRLVQQVGEEVLTEEELRVLFQNKKKPVAYDGFEPSGRMHIAQGLLRTINVNKMLKAGCTFTMLVADWHAWANNKLGGDLEKIQTTGEYMIEIWKACGMDTEGVTFQWFSDFVEDESYWKKVMQIGINSTLKRITRCSQIMGRKESDTLSASQIFYPVMQCADIFHLKADICQLGMDQRKVNILARELAHKLGFEKPVSVHHHMLMGLGQPPAAGGDPMDRIMALKMSKSNPDSAIFMTDSPSDVERKIGKAYCPAGVAIENPILEYCKYIIFERMKSLDVKRPSKYGGDLSFKNYQKLESVFASGKLHPNDLKPAVASALNELLEPIRKHFSKGKPQKLAEEVASFVITR